MEKSRQRPTVLRDGLIIERPDLQTLWQKYTYGLCTLLAWTIWLYLWLPLVSLLGWLFGVKVFYEHMILLGGYVGFLKLLGIYSLIVAVLGMSLVLWALSNQLRFRGKERRDRIPPATNEEVAHFFGLSCDQLDSAHTAGRLVISVGESGDSLQIMEPIKKWEKVLL